MSSTSTNNHMQPRAQAVPAPDVVARRMGEEMVLINMRTNRIYRLNRTGARFFELLSQSPSLELTEVEEQIAREFGVGEDVVRSEVSALLRTLEEEGLVRLGAR